MNINIKKKQNNNLSNNEINIVIEYSNYNENINKLENYINRFYKRRNEIYVKKNNVIVPILKEDIIKIYSIRKYNYCKTKVEEYEIKSKLYELENTDENFIRISKSCIVNIRHIKCFDLSHTGRILIKFDDNSEEVVSRRRASSVLRYLDERRI